MTSALDHKVVGAIYLRNLPSFSISDRLFLSSTYSCAILTVKDGVILGITSPPGLRIYAGQMSTKRPVRRPHQAEFAIPKTFTIGSIYKKIPPRCQKSRLGRLNEPLRQYPSFDSGLCAQGAGHVNNAGSSATEPVLTVIGAKSVAWIAMDLMLPRP